MIPASLFGCKILITGASGFLGSHLASRLCENGADVHAVSRSQRQMQANGPRWWHGDMAEIATVRELFHEVKPDVVFHLSGLATARPDRDLVLPTFHSLLVSTVNILMAAAESRSRRIVLAASLTEPQSGDSEFTPGSPYAAAKWASGAYGRMFHGLYNVPIVLVRPFMTYGPGQDESKLIPYVVLSLLKGEAPKLASGQQEIDWIYVDDVMDGFLAAASAPEIDGQTIDLGSGVLVPIRAVVGHLVQLMDAKVEPLFHALPDRPYEPVRMANIADAYAKLGWKPRTSLEEGLKRTVNWHRRQLIDSSRIKALGSASKSQAPENGFD
jgi:nucleoside-diphosphate-sugar epimerase